jgi:hypothetical protein
LHPVDLNLLGNGRRIDEGVLGYVLAKTPNDAILLATTSTPMSLAPERRWQAG